MNINVTAIVDSALRVHGASKRAVFAAADDVLRECEGRVEDLEGALSSVRELLAESDAGALCWEAIDTIDAALTDEEERM